MSLDVSSHDTTIVFDLLGDLYTVPITGGLARPLTSGMAFDAQPRFSPDGLHVAFISDRNGIPNLWVIDRQDQHLRRLSDLHSMSFGRVIASPTWAPDGRTIVVSQRLAAWRPFAAESLGGYVHGQRWLLAGYRVASGEMKWISDTSYQRAQQALEPAFGAEGRAVYATVESYSPPNIWPRPRNGWRIERLELATGRRTPEMVTFAGRDGMRPAVSPNGRWLVYVSSTGSRFGLRCRDLRTLAERWLVRERIDFPNPSIASEWAPGYAFTPDSKTLIAAYGGKLHRVDLATGHDAVIPFVVNVERELAPMKVHQATLPDTAVRTRSVLQPALSPDGQQVAFSALNRLWVMELFHSGRSVGSPRRLTADSAGEFYPSWSPDGAWIIYSTWRDGEGGAVRRVRVDRHPTEALAKSERLTTDTALYFHTAVTPDGERIVAVRAPMPPERILVHALANTAAVSLALVWLPSSGGLPMRLPVILSKRYTGKPQGSDLRRLPVEQLYFTSDPDRIYLGLSSLTWDGKYPRVEPDVASDSTVLPGLRELTGVVSPDRRRAILDHSYSLFESTVPAETGETPLDLDVAQQRSYGAPEGAAARWGRALAPWISWSRDGRRVLFSQGGTLFVGEVRPAAWTTFTRVDVPLRVPVDVPRGTLVLRGARLITMRNQADGRLEVIERGDLVVRDNRIIALGPQGSVPLPVGRHILNLAGKTLLPGYVDIHDHLLRTYGVDADECWICHAVLASGITSSRSALDYEYTYGNHLALAEQERAGQTVSPRIFSTGIGNSGSDRPIETLPDARAVAAPIVDYFGAETFKQYDAGATRQARQLVARATQEAGLNATVHVAGIGFGLTAFTDGFTGVEHTLSRSAPLYDDVVTFIAKSGTTHTMTYSSEVSPWQYLLRMSAVPGDLARLRRFVPPSARDVWAPTALVCQRESVDLSDLRRTLASAARIVRRGGSVGMGSHGLFGGLGFHFEMWLHALGGMSNHEILRSATIVGATAIGHAKDIGSLEPGKLADLQILDQNPLEDIHHTMSIRYIVKNGRLYQAEDLTEMWPRHRPLEPIYLYSSEPFLGGTRYHLAPRSRVGQGNEVGGQAVAWPPTKGSGSECTT